MAGPYPKQPQNPFSTRPASSAQRRALNLLLVAFGLAAVVVSIFVYGVIALDELIGDSNDLEQEHPRSDRGGLRGRLKLALAELRHATHKDDPVSLTSDSSNEKNIWKDRFQTNEEAINLEEDDGSDEEEHKVDISNPEDEVTPNKRIGETTEKVKQEHQKLLVIHQRHEFGQEKKHEHENDGQDMDENIAPQVLMPTPKPKAVVEESTTSSSHDTVHVAKERANKLGDTGDEEVKGEPRLATSPGQDENGNKHGGLASIVVKTKEKHQPLSDPLPESSSLGASNLRGNSNPITSTA